MADEKHVTLRYFASVREALGCDTERWQTRAATVAALHAELLNRGAPWADALSAKGLRMAHNHAMVAGEVALSAGDVVAFFPPVTGG